jgi:hypothetical protein
VEGRQEGRKEGREEGRKEGRAGREANRRQGRKEESKEKKEGRTEESKEVKKEDGREGGIEGRGRTINGRRNRRKGRKEDERERKDERKGIFLQRRGEDKSLQRRGEDKRKETVAAPLLTAKLPDFFPASFTQSRCGKIQPQASFGRIALGQKDGKAEKKGERGGQREERAERGAEGRRRGERRANRRADGNALEAGEGRKEGRHGRRLAGWLERAAGRAESTFEMASATSSSMRASCSAIVRFVSLNSCCCLLFLRATVAFLELMGPLMGLLMAVFRRTLS